MTAGNFRNSCVTVDRVLRSVLLQAMVHCGIRLVWRFCGFWALTLLCCDVQKCAASATANSFRRNTLHRCSLRTARSTSARWPKWTGLLHTGVTRQRRRRRQPVCLVHRVQLVMRTTSLWSLMTRYFVYCKRVHCFVTVAADSYCFCYWLESWAIISVTFQLGSSQLTEKHLTIVQQNFGLGLGSVLDLEIFIFIANLTVA